MLKARVKSLFFVFLTIVFCFSLFAQRPVFKPQKGLRWGFGAGIGFYSVNKKHTQGVTPKASAIIGFKKEWRLDKEYRTFFLAGVDFFYYGVGFKSYYFLPDTLALYNKQFNYDYSLMIHEWHLPLQFRYMFKRKDNKAYTSYVNVTYYLRYLSGSDLKITENGSKIKYDSPQLRFKNKLFVDQVNTFVGAGYGWQKNSIGASKSNFYMEINYRYGFSPYYFDKPYAASSLFINSSHIFLLVGLKI